MAFQQIAPTHQEVKHQLWAKYDCDIASGRFVPFSYPFGACGSSTVLYYFLSGNNNDKARWIVWAINFILAMYCILYTRARTASASYGVGLGNAWSILWFTAILLAKDGKKRFSRIERVGGATLTVPMPKRHMSSNGSGNFHRTPDVEELASGDLENRKNAIKSPTPASTLGSLKYHTQSYPTESFLERLDWSIDLLSNFRGVSWNWKTVNIPLPPKSVVEDIRTYQRLRIGFPPLHDPLHIHGREGQGRRSHFVQRNPTKQQSLRRALRNLVVGYIMLDLLKTLCIHDPYFSGFTGWPAPNYFPDFLKDSAIFVRCYRLMLAMLCIYLSLQTIFALAPIFFVGIVGAEQIGVRGEPWMYPEEWGSYLAVFDLGLAGWWGVWWHQTFRFAFEATASWILARFPILNDAGPKARAVQLFTAFWLSGFLHASGSYTSIGETRPLMGSFLFFFLQSFGIMVQTLLVKKLWLIDTPLILKAFNFIYTHVWFYYTAPFLIDDLVKSGIYLYEPVPVSILRAFGFGAEGDTWWCWDGPWISWHQGRNWWQSGIAT